MKTVYEFPSGFTSRLAIFLVYLLLVLASCSKDYKDPSNDDNNNNPPPQGGLLFNGDFEKSSADVSTQAMGSVNASLDTTNLRLTYSINWNYLSSKPVAMHFHDNGPIIVSIQNFPATVDGSVSDTATLTAQQVMDLKDGKLYAQIHTENFKGGEVLAHLSRK